MVKQGSLQCVVGQQSPLTPGHSFKVVILEARERKYPMLYSLVIKIVGVSNIGTQENFSLKVEICIVLAGK